MYLWIDQSLVHDFHGTIPHAFWSRVCDAYVLEFGKWDTDGVFGAGWSGMVAHREDEEETREVPSSFEGSYILLLHSDFFCSKPIYPEFHSPLGSPLLLCT